MGLVPLWPVTVDILFFLTEDICILQMEGEAGAYSRLSPKKSLLNECRWLKTGNISSHLLCDMENQEKLL